MALRNALRMGREAYMRRGLLSDRCVVRRPTGEMEENPDFTVTPAYEVVYHPDDEPFKGACRIHGDRPHEQSLTAGAATHTVQRLLVSLPALAGPFAAGDVVTVIESHDQPNMVGRSYRVGGIDERSQQTAQRMYIDLSSALEVPPWQE